MVNSSSTSRSIIIIFVTITSSCIIKIPISLIISTSIFELFTFPFVLNQYTPPRFFLRDHNGNKNSKLSCVVPATTLPQLLQFSILMNLYFVHVINIRFICDGEIYLYTYLCYYFDNSIPKDGVDHELNVTHRHDWPNKNVRVLKSLSEKSQSI